VSAERSTTIGRERRWNALLQAASETEFIAQALRNLPDYPTYFRYMRAINQRGPKVLMSLPKLEALSPENVHELMTQGVAVIDMRSAHEYMTDHILGSYGIPLGAPLITWAGWVVPFGTPIILIADDPIEREAAVRQLIRIGYDDLRGYLDESPPGQGRADRRCPACQRKRITTRGTQIVLDVRHLTSGTRDTCRSISMRVNYRCLSPRCRNMNASSCIVVTPIDRR
jgi:rhodanese-related sulfurtransferase